MDGRRFEHSGMNPRGEGPDSGRPPWVLGQRGVPLEAPENTLASFERALELGADGLHYDLRAAGRGEPVVMRDSTCLRTAEVSRALAELSPAELAALDVGAWFSKDFVGEPVPYLEEVLTLQGSYGGWPMHFVELHDGELIGELRRTQQSLGQPISLRVGSVRRDQCLELRDAGLASVLMVRRANKSDLLFARDERLSAVAVTVADGWSQVPAEESWPFERWALGAESAEELFAVMGHGINALSTSEVTRAQNIRRLMALCGDGLAEYPLRVSELPVASGTNRAGSGDWLGDWKPELHVSNPFPYPVRLALELFVRRGAFDAQGLPVLLELQARESRSLEFQLKGGSFSPGGDPLILGLFEWGPGPGRKAGRLLLETTLRRVRQARADGRSQRVEMLRERPGQAAASMTVLRRVDSIVLRVENAGGLQDVRALARLDGQTWSGGAVVRIPLPAGFDDLKRGVAFSCGFWGRPAGGGAQELRRWAGGLPAEPRSGDAGWLVPGQRG